MKTETTVYPTHTCFDDAMEFVNQAVIEHGFDKAFDTFFLCHGICAMPDGRLFAHAWVVELDRAAKQDYVWFSGVWRGQKIFGKVCKADFYNELVVTSDVTQYDMLRVCNENVKHGTFGPWEERYLALCAKPGTIKEAHRGH